MGLRTPFDDTLDIEYEKLVDSARTLYDEGIRTFMAAANISEYHSLSRDERISLVDASVEALPDDACVLGGVGGSTPQAIELERAYEAQGVDALMTMPPDHTYLHERGLLQYYRKLDDATDCRLVPYVRGFDPSVEYLADLTRIDGVVGIRYALFDALEAGNWERARELRNVCLPYQRFREETGRENTIPGASSVAADLYDDLDADINRLIE